MSRFANFQQFYSFYLSEHRHPVSRRLHFVGTWGAFVCVVMLAWTQRPYWILLGLLSGYSFAWVGHYFFEKNTPATFRHPFYSFAADWVMWWQLNMGKLRFRE